MSRLATFLSLAALVTGAASAQPVRKERDVGVQRAAVEAWTTCIADEQTDRVAAVLQRDFTSREYRSELVNLAQTRVSRKCFDAMPRAYRRIELGGLPFAGGLAERMIERDPEPLVTRLSMAALKTDTPTYSLTDAIAMCTVRGAPHLVATLFGTAINSPEETEAVAKLQPIVDICASRPGRLQASAFGMRSILATASYRLLEARGKTQ